jgi:hypothetical protein
MLGGTKFLSVEAYLDTLGAKEGDPLNFVYIDGPAEMLLGLKDIRDIDVQLSSSEILPDGQIRVAGYATDEAIGEIQGRGATVTVIFNNEELQARTDELFPPDEGPPVG